MNRIEDYHSNVSSTYLTDESGITGTAKAIFFPETQKELQDIVAFARQEHQHVVIQGARTGFNAGAVPDGGFIVNLSKMSAVTGFRYDVLRLAAILSGKKFPKHLSRILHEHPFRKRPPRRNYG